MRTHICLSIVAALAAAGTALAWTAAPPPGAAADWASHGGGADEAGYSRLTQIDMASVSRLGLAWSLDLNEVTLEATPLAVNGMLYFTGSHARVYAVDGITGKTLWTYDPQVWKLNPQRMHYTFGANRGVAYADGRVFVAAIDGRLIALDAKTGKPAWTVQTLPADGFHSITGAPRTFNGKVIIGNSGADFNGQRGFVTAYDAATGKQLWRFYTTPGTPDQNKGDPAMERAAATWSGEWWKTGTGGTVWNGITFDAELNRIYLGTGNAGPYNPRVRNPQGGDNLYTASIVALDADSGRYVWHYQVNPNDAWDYKATANLIATTLTIDGRPRRVLMQSPTNGFFYVLDRDTGKLISAEKTGKVTWADRIDLKTGRPVERPNIRYETGDSILYPSMIGSHNWQDMSFDPATGLVYIPHMQLGARYTTRIDPGNFSFAGMQAVAHVDPKDPQDGTGALLAWDPIRQRARWKVAIPTIWNGGTLATAGGLVFQGTAEGYLSAYAAATGKRLWRFDAGLGIVAAPISYSAGGRQYVSVLVGYGGTVAAMSQVLNVGWKYGAQQRRLLTFALDGKAVLPRSAPRDMTVHALDDPAMKLSEADVAAGRALSVGCLACHGPGMASGGAPGPDLRESAAAMDPEAFWAIVHDGALIERGMPRFETFTRDQARQLQAYIRATAREALGTRKPMAPAATERM